jgi:hypothetical protein
MRFSDKEKQYIYSVWSKYQVASKYPPPEYSYMAYTDDAYALWYDVLTSEGIKIILPE